MNASRSLFVLLLIAGFWFVWVTTPSSPSDGSWLVPASRERLARAARSAAIGPLGALTAGAIAWNCFWVRRMRARVRRAEGRLCIHCAAELAGRGVVDCPSCQRKVDAERTGELWNAWHGTT